MDRVLPSSVSRHMSRDECNYYFFFSSRRRHTRLQGDWSSDVCSSDLTPPRCLMGHNGDRLPAGRFPRSEEHTSELQSPCNLVCRLLLEKKKKHKQNLIREHQSRPSAITTTVRGALACRDARVRLGVMASVYVSIVSIIFFFFF